MSNNALQVFSNSEFHVRTINDNGETWFVAKDIAEALEYSNASIKTNIRNLMQSVPDIWKGNKRIITLGGEQEMLCLTEQGVYFFLGRSDKKKALPYQIWIARDVVPSIRKSGSYNVRKDDGTVPSGVMESARLIFEVAGIKDNQLALALDKVHRSYTGQSALEAGGIVLEAPDKNQLLTPTDIGKHFGLKAHRVNEILAGAGYQHKIGGIWEALPLGEPYSIMQDVGKRHSNGTPVRQLKWTSNILQVFPSLQND